MSTEQVKKAFQEAKKDLEKDDNELLKARIKDVIKTTLEKIEEEEKVVLEHQKVISVLKKDLKDLENGRLDLIEERQKADPKAKEISVALVERMLGNYERAMENSRKIVYMIRPRDSVQYYGGPASVQRQINTIWSAVNGASDNTSTTANFTATGYDARNFTAGTYSLKSGKVIDLRPF